MELHKTDLQEKIVKARREGEERSAGRLAQKLGYQYINLTKTPVSIDALRLVSEQDAKSAKVATIELKAKKVALAAISPQSPATTKIIKDLEKKKYEVAIFVVSLSGLEQIWGLYKFVRPESERITGRVNIGKKRLEDLALRLGSLKVVREEIKKLDLSSAAPSLLIETVLGGALSLGASDVHLETGDEKMKVRFRVDGLLQDIFDSLPQKNYDALVSRIKLLSGLKINVRDEAQDGRFTIGFGKKEIEIRVSIIPSEFGENVVMRILDPEVTTIGLSSLGLREDDLEIVNRQTAKPNGLILNTGPTGSGKTTTLYAFIREVNNPEIKIITLEDPVEYHVEGIEQTQVDDRAGYTFANGLRAIVRQDPDVILVGEIRDRETADIALQAALTGHLVLSTLHTNDAVGAVPRLINLGVKAASIGPALNLIIAQRLVRKFCLVCRKVIEPPIGLKTKIKKFLNELPPRVDRAKYENYKLYGAVGCSKCNDTGYKGRVGIFEFLEGGTGMEEVLLKDVSGVALKKLSKEQEMVTMQEDGILKVLASETSLEEVEDATGKIEWS